jgi:Tol biopolymer transport system component
VNDSTLDFLTHQPVSGQTLADRLTQGAFTPEEALRYAVELGSIIGKAHTRGQVHGKICPRNIVLTDQGLRLLEPPKTGDAALPYQSPEQTRAEAPDNRSDIWAFGAVAYEMASGRKPFPGTGMELKTAIQSQNPDPLELASSAGAALEGVIVGCLEKDPGARRQRIQNAVIELKLSGGKASVLTEPPVRKTFARTAAPSEELAASPAAKASYAAAAKPSKPPVVKPAPAADEPYTAEPPVSKPRPAPAAQAPRPVVYSAFGGKLVYGNALQRRYWMMGAAAALLLVSGAGAAFYLHQKSSAPVLKFAITQPEHTSYPGMPAVSPDGRYLTFSAIGPEGKRMLWLRPLDALHATVIPGTEGASAPFWSPDSRYIGFFASLSLKKVAFKDGQPQKICDAEATPGGGAWEKDGSILFARNLSDGFWRVPSTGGKPVQVLKLVDANNERGAIWPQMLPDGKHFVFYMQTDNAETAGVYVGVTDTGEHHRLFTSQTNAVYSTPTPDAKNGYLVYINERNLTAVQFNSSKLETIGDPVILANDIGAVRSLSLAPISVSNNGVLVYQGVGQPTRQMIWMDRNGKQLAVAGEPGEYGPPRISPDGNRGVVAKMGPDGKSAHIWLLDRTGTVEQITHTEGVHEGSPVWAPDGNHVVYFAAQGKSYDLFTRLAVPEARPELVVHSDAKKYPTDWSRDGKYILFGIEGEGTRLDVWGFSAGDRRAAPILDTVYDEGFGAISPDGKWLAYQASNTGRTEVYIQAFEGLSSGTKRRWQVSKAGGGLPRWASNGNELFFITQDGRLHVSQIRATADGVEPGNPQMLFQTRGVPKAPWNLYDVTPDGQRFLFNMPLEWTSANPITVVTNWTEKLKEE